MIDRLVAERAKFVVRLGFGRLYPDGCRSPCLVGEFALILIDPLLHISAGCCNRS
jgi:hypothetical protein